MDSKVSPKFRITRGVGAGSACGLRALTRNRVQVAVDIVVQDQDLAIVQWPATNAFVAPSINTSVCAAVAAGSDAHLRRRYCGGTCGPRFSCPNGCTYIGVFFFADKSRTRHRKYAIGTGSPQDHAIEARQSESDCVRFVGKPEVIA